jgi:hypothetical protein
MGRLVSVNNVRSRGQNRTREIRPSGIAGGLAETWIMEEAKRARKAETPEQPSRHLMSSAPYFYPDNCTAGSVRGVVSSQNSEHIYKEEKDVYST